VYCFRGVPTVLFCATLLILPSFVRAQNADRTESVAASSSVEQPQPESVDKRIFGVLPNYRTADASAPFVPITSKRKFSIASKDSFDYPVILLAGAFAALYQLEDQDPSFGQGMKGYGKRIAASYGDQVIGNFMAEAIFPSLLHEDPRYFRLGSGGGSTWHRTRYAVARVFVVRTDKGNWRFNFSEWLGNGAAVGLSNLYYPAETRNVTDNVQKLGLQIGTDAISQVLKEFWPDWKRKLSR
jgi:hypothetical protein